jgi:hypothetical protein
MKKWKQWSTVMERKSAEVNPNERSCNNIYIEKRTSRGGVY